MLLPRREASAYAHVSVGDMVAWEGTRLWGTHHARPQCPGDVVPHGVGSRGTTQRGDSFPCYTVICIHKNFPILSYVSGSIISMHVLESNSKVKDLMDPSERGW